MVKFVNRNTGGIMYVHESRVDEYKAAGHRPAAELQEPPIKKRETAKKSGSPKKRGQKNDVRNSAGRSGENAEDALGR